LSKLKYLLPRTTLQQLYYALIHPSLLYGIIIWGSTFNLSELSPETYYPTKYSPESHLWSSLP